MNIYAPDLIIGMVRLLNRDASYETARLLAGEIISSVIVVGESHEDRARDLDHARRVIFEPIHKHVDTLQKLVDEWIDSGVKDDDSEEPGTRHLKEGGGDVEYEERDGRFIAIVKPKSRILRMAYEYQKRHAVFIELQPEGGTDVLFAPVSGGENGMPEQEAVRLFIQFYGSAWVKRLMRCAQCKVYALVASPRESYRYGWHCGKCRKSAPAARRTRETRSELKNTKLNCCAKAYADWFRASRRDAKKGWILERVNKRLTSIHPLDCIKQNFITRNFEEILRRAREIQPTPATHRPSRVKPRLVKTWRSSNHREAAEGRTSPVARRPRKRT